MTQVKALLFAACAAAPALLTGCVMDDGDAALDDGKGDVYGADDRLDWHQAPAPWQRIARESIVSFIDPGRLQAFQRGHYQTLLDRDVCPDQRFVHQPLLALGSGYLVNRQMVASAAHVWRSTICTEDCDAFADDHFDHADCMAMRTRVVFGPRYVSYTSMDEIADDDVYLCDSLVGSRYEGLDDWAVMKLDRPVSDDKVPVRVRARPVSPGEGLVLVSHPGGLPVKIDQGGQVVDILDYGFSATVDAFHGSSGGAVFDDQGLLVGHLVRGPADYRRDPIHECDRVAENDPDAPFINQIRRSSFLTPTH